MFGLHLIYVSKLTQHKAFFVAVVYHLLKISQILHSLLPFYRIIRILASFKELPTEIFSIWRFKSSGIWWCYCVTLSLDGDHLEFRKIVVPSEGQSLCSESNIPEHLNLE